MAIVGKGVNENLMPIPCLACLSVKARLLTGEKIKASF